MCFFLGKRNFIQKLLLFRIIPNKIVMKKSLICTIAILLNIAILPLGRAFATKHVISVQSNFFNPSSITDVVVGDTMRWVWVSGSHTTTSTTIPAGASTWNSTINSTTTSYEYKVTVAGTFNYKCTPHAAMGMIGSFVATAPAATLSVLPGNQNVTAGAGSTTFSVTSNSNWTALSNAIWCTATASGSGNGTITANYAANATVTQRVATISISVAGLPSVLVTVTQAGAAATLVVDPVNQNVGYQAGTTTFNVSSNTNWTTLSNSDWCTATLSGTGNGTITANYQENPTNATRIATLTINVSGLAPQMVTVTQDLSSVSVVETPGNSFRIFPNPTEGRFTISLGNLSNKSAEMSVINAIGEVVYSQHIVGSELNSFNLSNLNHGSYFVRIIAEDVVKLSKLVIIE
jgi:plastocyanin